MADFWVKEAIDILRQNGSREPADAVEALAARLAETQQCLEDTCAQLAIEAQRLAEAERVLRSIAANTCCEPCQEAKRVAQAYFGPADSADVAPEHVPNPHKCSFCAMGLTDMVYEDGRWLHDTGNVGDVCTATTVAGGRND